MSLLRDGTVVPSYLTPFSTPSPEDSGQFRNYSLRLGEVKDILLPTDVRNLSKKVIEYRVVVQHRDGVEAGTAVEYPNCVVMNLFGGIADKLRYTLRPSAEKNLDPETGRGDGSKVLLLCVNGETSSPYIIGGYNEQTDLVEVDKGHNLELDFNGISAIVDKDGQLIVKFIGATKANGQLKDGVDAKASGTYFQILKDGSFIISNGDATQVWKMDRTGKKTAITADAELDVTVTNGNMVIKSKGVLVGDATDAWMLGTTYRKGEAQCNKQVSASLAIIAQAAAAAAAALQAAGSVMSAGVVGNIPAAPSVLAAGVQMQLIAAQAQVAKTAIDTFEAQASTYLSKKNKTD